MDKFCQVVFKIAEISSSAEKDVIQQHLTDFTSNFHTPNHPPYAAMIEKAISELNEKTGSSEESISNYVIMEYKDLPWAHSTILKHHLTKLCEFGEISMTCKGRYIIGVPKPKRENINKKLKSKSKSMRGRSRNKKEINIDVTFQDERVVMRENKNEEKNYTLETPNAAIGEENEVILNINEQENVVIDLTSLPVTSEKLEQVKIENLQESDTIFTATRKVNLDLREKEEDENYPSFEVKLNPKPEDGEKLEIESERTDLENVGLTEELNLAPELLNAAIEKENEDTELEYEPINRLNYNFPQFEPRLATAHTLCLNLDSHEKEEDENHPDLEAEANPNPEYGKKLECDCERTDLVKVGLTKEQNLAPELLNVAIVKENEDVELESESENRLNHNIRQSNSNITTACTLFMNLDSHEKEEDEKHLNSEAELNSKLEDDKKLEIDSERDIVKVGSAEKQYLAPLLPNVAMEKENEDVEVESEPENGLNHNLLQSESSLKTAHTGVKLDSHAREEDEKCSISEAESNPKPEYGKELDIDSEIADLVKVGLAEEHNLAPKLSSVAMTKENEDVEVDSEPENRLNHTRPQSESCLKAARTLCVSLDSHEKEDKKHPNSKPERNPKLDGKKLEYDRKTPEGQEPEKDGEKPDKFGEEPEKDGGKPESDGEKPDLTLNSENINEEDESKSEKAGIKPKKDDERTSLTIGSDHVDEEDESTISIMDGGKPENDDKTPEKHGEIVDLSLNSEDIEEEDESNISDNKTDRQQRQLKRWRQSQPKVKPEQIPMKNKDNLDEEKCQQQKQESGIRQQPKRQLRSQSQSQTSETVVNHVRLSSPEKSNVLKRAKINTESQTRRLTRSAAAKSAESKLSRQIPLQRTKLRSWHKQNNFESNMEWSTESSSPPADRQNSSSQSRLKRGKR